MKKLILAACYIGLLSGCQRIIEKPELDQMESSCKEHGGIYKIDTFLLSSAKCNDGTWSEQK